jgi:hypothetical protein
MQPEGGEAHEGEDPGQGRWRIAQRLIRAERRETMKIKTSVKAGGVMMSD